jgi:hypothetical protein
MNILTAPNQITSVVISENLSGSTITIRKGIHLSFVPDIIQVSHVFYEATAADVTIHKITSNLISTEDGVIQSVYDGVQYAVPMVFSNNKPIDGSYEFDFSDGGLSAGIFSMNLTFIKY